MEVKFIIRKNMQSNAKVILGLSVVMAILSTSAYSSEEEPLPIPYTSLLQKATVGATSQAYSAKTQQMGNMELKEVIQQGQKPQNQLKPDLQNEQVVSPKSESLENPQEKLKKKILEQIEKVKQMSDQEYNAWFLGECQKIEQESMEIVQNKALLRYKPAEQLKEKAEVLYNVRQIRSCRSVDSKYFRERVMGAAGYIGQLQYEFFLTQPEQINSREMPEGWEQEMDRREASNPSLKIEDPLNRLKKDMEDQWEAMVIVLESGDYSQGLDVLTPLEKIEQQYNNAQKQQLIISGTKQGDEVNGLYAQLMELKKPIQAKFNKQTVFYNELQENDQVQQLNIGVEKPTSEYWAQQVRNCFDKSNQCMAKAQALSDKADACCEKEGEGAQKYQQLCEESKKQRVLSGKFFSLGQKYYEEFNRIKAEEVAVSEKKPEPKMTLEQQIDAKFKDLFAKVDEEPNQANVDFMERGFQKLQQELKGAEGQISSEKMQEFNESLETLEGVLGELKQNLKLKKDDSYNQMISNMFADMKSRVINTLKNLKMQGEASDAALSVSQTEKIPSDQLNALIEKNKLLIKEGRSVAEYSIELTPTQKTQTAFCVNQLEAKNELLIQMKIKQNQEGVQSGQNELDRYQLLEQANNCIVAAEKQNEEFDKYAQEAIIAKKKAEKIKGEKGENSQEYKDAEAEGEGLLKKALEANRLKDALYEKAKDLYKQFEDLNK